MTNIFTFKTPDNKFIQLKKLTFQEKTDILLNVTDKQRIRTLDTIQNPAYILPNGTVLHETTLNTHTHLFDTAEAYKSFIKGENFYDSVVLYDDTKGYASFGIKPSKINSFLKEEHIIDTAYTDKENYKACIFKDGSVCFVKNISQKAKRAFWFESKAAFEYYFYYVFDNEVS